MYQQLTEKGVRISLDVEEIIRKSGKENEVIERILALGKPFITKDDVHLFLLPEKTELATGIEVNKAASFYPEAREHDSDIRILHTHDVTGKSRTKGEVGNFVNYFRNRYDRLSGMLRGHFSKYPTVELANIKRSINERVRVIVLVSSKKETKKGNLLLEVEDKTGSFKVVISGNNSRYGDRTLQKARNILQDDVIAVNGKVLEPFIIAEDIEWPDLPLRERKLAENDLAVAYLSDLHFGSKHFLDKYLQEFVNWIHCKGAAKELAGKVKYVIIAGDIVDGIGIYPNQEKDLEIKDITKQYEMFDDFVESLPDYIEVIVAPGNHDAVRRGEPMPAIDSDLIKTKVTSVGNPSMVMVEGLKHLIYHATSIDSMISSLQHASYMHPEKVMVEYLIRRHLSPIYGGNLIIPENIYYMVIDDEPDVLHGGHVHRNGHTYYRGTLVINSGTFQDRTDYQIKQGHVPTPALVPVYEMKYGRLRLLDFKN